MKLMTFESQGGLALGLVMGDRVMDIRVADSRYKCGAPASMQALLGSGKPGLAALELLGKEAEGDSRVMRPLAELKPGPALPDPGKIICVGLNYRQHAIESGMEIPDEPVLFSKFSNSISAAGSDIHVSGLSQLDYEAELAVVIAQRAKNVAVEDALDMVLGYCNANDLSERDLQFRSGQWLLGKTLDGFLPIGPWLRTPEAGFDAQNLDIRGWLNGELRQDSNTSDMIFSIAELISYISRYMTLEAGDLIITGTPMGVILGRKEKVWMKPGDEYTVEITGLGRLTNRLVS
jgi:2-keto-4-pentenoate hydratase/2-oxohepta-3-ene-1,7-dioic acid hydratase in catechol pathway